MVNWNAVGAIGEILGAVAVVITLLYLSKQIRQNTRSVQVAALRDTTSQWHQWSALLATSPELAEVVARGNRSLAELSEAETLRYGAFVQMFFDNAQSELELVRTHRVGDDIRALESIVRRRMRIDGFAQWWEENTEDYDADFVAWIESQRGRATDRT